MFIVEMNLSSYFTCFHVLELLLFITVIFIYLSYMLVLFGIKIFIIFKYVRSMSLISIKLQQFIGALINCDFSIDSHR
jgi:hypothetical protein